VELYRNLITAALSLVILCHTAQAKQQLAITEERKIVRCLTDNLRVTFGMSDAAAPSMEKMVNGLRRSQGVTVEYDKSLKVKRIGGRSLADRPAIILGSKAQNESTKAFLIHEAVHTTTEYRIRTERSIKACAQGVKFEGNLISAPAGYRSSFRIDEIDAHRKESIYQKNVSESPETPYLMQVKMKKLAESKQENAQQFKNASVDLLNLIQEKLDTYAKENPGKTYPFTTAPRPNAPGILNLEMTFNQSEFFPLIIKIPVPIDLAHEQQPSSAELFAIVKEVLSAAQASVTNSR
jgi:hypothetical protein